MTFAEKLNDVLQDLMYNTGPGAKFIPVNWLINVQKGGSVFFFLWLQWYYQNWSYGAWMYIALHGCYGIIWLIKDMIFPDKNFQKK